MFNSNCCGGGYSGYSLADVAAVTGNGAGRSSDGMGWGDGGAWWIIILFLFVFCGWGNGNGFGNGGGAATQGALTRGDLCMDMNFNDLQSGVRNVSDAVNAGFANLNSTICHQQYDTATMINGVQAEIASGFAGVDNAVCTLGYQTQAGINSINVANMQNTNAIQSDIQASMINAMQNQNALQAQIAECCCENRAGQADIKYQMATDACAVQTSIANSTRDIIDSAAANTRSILDFLVQDKISSLQSENQTLKFAASQAAQNQYLVNELRPCPVPAYITPNPWASNYNLVAYNNGCGCSGFAA